MLEIFLACFEVYLDMVHMGKTTLGIQGHTNPVSISLLLGSTWAVFDQRLVKDWPCPGLVTYDVLRSEIKLSRRFKILWLKAAWDTGHTLPSF